MSTLPSLPAVVIELLQTMDQEEADMHLLAEKLSRDQALSAKVLRVANSSFYGMSGKVNSIADAMVVLGLRGVRTLAMAASISDTFSATRCPGFDFRMFWRHSIGVALCAKEIARQCRQNDGNAFTAGLLHDLGRLVLASCFPQHLVAVMAYRERMDCPWEEAEQQVLGMSHAELGGLLAMHWNFPASLHAAITHHHDMAGDDKVLSCTLVIADALAHALDLSGDENEMVSPITEVCWQTLSLPDENWLALFAIVESQFEAACESLLV